MASDESSCKKLYSFVKDKKRDPALEQWYGFETHLRDVFQVFIRFKIKNNDDMCL